MKIYNPCMIKFDLQHPSYGGWWDYLVFDAKSAVKRSAERYIRAIS